MAFPITIDIETQFALRRLDAAVTLAGGDLEIAHLDAGIIRPAGNVAQRLLKKGFLAGLPLADVNAGGPNDLLIAVTEKRSRAELDTFAWILEDAACS